MLKVFHGSKDKESRLEKRVGGKGRQMVRSNTEESRRRWGGVLYNESFPVINELVKTLI
jgi:hypothetical protein